MTSRAALLRLLLALGGGALLAAAHSLHPAWWTAWLGAALVLAATVGVRPGRAALLGALAGAIASVSLLGYLVGLAGPLDALLLSAARAGQWALLAGAGAFVVDRLPPWAALPAVPALGAGIELLMLLASPHGAAGSLATSQADALPVVQAAAVGGAPAIVLLVLVGANAVALAASARTARRAAIGGLLVVLLVAGGGALRLAQPLAEPSGATAGLVVTDEFTGVPDDWRAVWRVYRAGAAEAVAQGAEVVVLPEKLFAVPAGELAEFEAEAGGFAGELGIDLVVGYAAGGDARETNRLTLFAADGTATHYDKRHLIPFAETRRFDAGDATVLGEAAGMRAGLAVCKDLDFPITIRELGAAGAEVLLVPAWDFRDDDWFHSRLAVLRGVENGVGVVRAARNGLLTMSDAHGRVVAERESAGELRILIGAVPGAAAAPTLYPRIGDAVGWTALLAALVLLGAAVRRRGDEAAPDAVDAETATADR